MPFYFFYFFFSLSRLFLRRACRSAEEVFVDMVETHGFHLQDILLIFKDCLIASISNIAKATPVHLLNSFKVKVMFGLLVINS